MKVKQSIFGKEDGRIKCLVCNSIKGIYLWKYRRSHDYKKWWNKKTCVNCGSFEKVLNVADQRIPIIEQEIREG